MGGETSLIARVALPQVEIWPWWNISVECQDINCRLPCCWWIEEQIYRCSLVISTQISFISSCSAPDLGHKMHLYLRRITSGCCHCVDTVHLPFTVSGRKKKEKKSISRGGHLHQDLIPFQSEERLWAVSTKQIFTIRPLKTLKTILHMAALPPENGTVWLMPNDEIRHFPSSLIHRWIMVATRRYKSHPLGDKLEMGNGVNNSLKMNRWNKTVTKYVTAITTGLLLLYTSPKVLQAVCF